MRHRGLFFGIAAIALTVVLLGGIRAQQPNSAKPIAPLYVATFVDITPGNADAGTAIVKQYVIDSRKDPGNVRAEALVQANRLNHLLVVEVWKDQAAFDKHEAAEHTIDYRKKLGPMLGAPFDQRLHFVLE